MDYYRQEELAIESDRKDNELIEGLMRKFEVMKKEKEDGLKENQVLKI
jgi:hypothetical protein